MNIRLPKMTKTGGSYLPPQSAVPPPAPPKRAKEPYFLCEDDSGHHYLVAESSIARFHELVELIGQGEDDDKIWAAWDKLKKIQIDGPHRLKILEWEEMP